jgi:HAD superfamily hydrolase (TIGR01509 family)
MGTIRAVVFDFDGLMVDTEMPAYQAWLELYQEHEQTFPLERWCATLGGVATDFDPITYLSGLIEGPVDVAALRERRQRRKQELAARAPLMPGVAAYLDDAARLGVRLGVASSSPRAWVLEHLNRLGVATRFMAIVTADNVAHVKPAPDLYLAAVAALGVVPIEAIALEDAPSGVLSAKRAGLWAVAVPNPLTRHLPLDHADMRITSLADVPLAELLTVLPAVPANR